jgi:hypothetical protein
MLSPANALPKKEPVRHDANPEPLSSPRRGLSGRIPAAGLSTPSVYTRRQRTRATGQVRRHRRAIFHVDVSLRLDRPSNSLQSYALENPIAESSRMKPSFALVTLLLLLSFPVHAQNAGPLAVHPTAFLCVPKLNPARQPIPAGKRINDLCPAGTSALLFPDPGTPPRPGAAFQLTTFACFPQPRQQPRPIPAGKTKDFDELCLPGDTAWLFTDPLLASSSLSPPIPIDLSLHQDTSKKTR